jgi:hypothetical protein
MMNIKRVPYLLCHADYPHVSFECVGIAFSNWRHLIKAIGRKFPYVCPLSGAFHISEAHYRAYAVVYGQYYSDLDDIRYGNVAEIHGTCDCCGTNIGGMLSVNNLFKTYCSQYSFVHHYAKGLVVLMPPMFIKDVRSAIPSREVPLFISLDGKIVAAYVIDYLMARIAYEVMHDFKNPDVVSIVNAVAYDCFYNVEAEEDTIVAAADDVLLRSKGTFYSMSNIRKMTRVTWQEFVQITSQEAAEGGNK